jgi:TetR/AcrR family transcriptional regulator, regulator of autoinduction and epiphytic fitness
VDGRVERSERSRSAIVDAMLALLREGNVRPSAESIAAGAGVSMRTLFRHIDDLDELFAAAVEAQSHHLRDLHGMRPADGPLARRIDAVVAHRSRLYEEIGPVRRAAMREVSFHKAVAAGIERSGRELRQQVELVFEPELRAAGRRRRALSAAVDVATSWRAWEALRADQGLTVTEAEAATRFALLALLDRGGTR